MFNAAELVQRGVLPDIMGLYTEDDHLIDGVIISHPHQDHYGLSSFISKDVKHYLGEATHKIIEISNLFMSQQVHIESLTCFEKKDIPDR